MRGMTQTVLDWGLNIQGPVRLFLSVAVRTTIKSFDMTFIRGLCAGNPTRGVFERAVAAAEKAKYW